MPALGMAQETGLILAWRKAEGDPVAIGDPLFDVETDKTTMEVEAIHAGTLTEIRASAGVDIPVGQTIAIISEASSEVPTGTRVDVTPELAATVETKPRTSSAAPPSPRLLEQQGSRDKPAAPSTPSAAPILASPKAKFEAYRRGIDLRYLVDQGIAQPFHVADLDRLKPDLSVTPSKIMSRLSGKFDSCAFDAFVAWAEEKTGRRDMHGLTLASFASAAFRAVARPGNDSSLLLSVHSIRMNESEMLLRDPDLHGLGSLDQSTSDRIDAPVDLMLIDLCGTRLLEYEPPMGGRGSPVVIVARTEDVAVATCHFCENDLPLGAAARFLDGFAARAAEPALHLL